VKGFVREHVLFTPHSLLRDPPFSNLDLISCRNLLIYLQRDLHTSVFDLFAYALNEDGHLFLGSSESAERADGGFRTVDASHRIYQLRNQQQAVPKLPSLPLTATPTQLDVRGGPGEAVPSEATAHQRLLEAYSPPSVVVNDDYRLLHLSDDAGRYLKHLSGTPRTGVIEEGDVDGEEASTEDKLRAELKQTKKELRATVEEYESSQQKLQAANEELRSMNEEYKLMTEELETSKEELQSVNEELKTVNRELEEKVEQLRQANSDLKNVMASTQIGTLFLDRELHVQRYTPRVKDFFNVRPEDEGRPIGDITHHLGYDRLEADAESVLDDLKPIQREVPTDEGEWVLVRIHPYRTHDDRTAMTDALDAARETGEPFELQFRVQSDDSVRWLYSKGEVKKDDGTPHLHGAAVDVTERQEARAQLRAANEKLRERAEQVQSLSEALTSAEERVRRRISRLLHDEVQQSLYGAMLTLDNLREQEAMTDDQRALIDEARDQVEEASLFLVQGEERVRVVVEDAGVGFDPSEIEEWTSGTGLAGLQERIEVVGGQVEIHTTPGSGTRVSLEVPRQTGDGINEIPL